MAKLKGQNTVVWVIITLIAFFFTYILGSVVLISIVYNGPYEQAAIMEYLMDHTLLMFTMPMFGIGGYLIIRYILERMPDVKGE